MSTESPAQSASSPVSSPSKEIELTLFLVALVTFGYFYQASDHNTAARFDLIRSILERHTLWIDGYCGFNTADLVNMNGHYFSNKAPGGSLTGIVPWIVSLGLSSPLRAYGDALYWGFVTYLSTVLTVSLLVALMAVLLYRLALFFGASQGRAVAVGLTLAFATIMFPHATEFAGEPIAATCIIAAFYLLATAEMQTGLVPSLGAGLLAGSAGLCDYPTILLSMIIALYALKRLRTWREYAWFVAGAALIAGLLLAYDTAAFGHPFFLSYEAYMLPGHHRFPAQARGFAGVTYPRFPILWQVLFGPERGLFFCNPVLLLTIPGLVYLWRREKYRTEFWVIAGSIAVFTLLSGSYGDSIVYWGGGTATGPRHMLSAIPYMVLALAFLPANWNAAFAALAFASSLLMLMATAIEPHLPYEYSNPFRDFLWQAFVRGDFAYNKSAYFGGGPIVGDSVAFNLGKLARLPGWLQLWPLATVWIVAAFDLFDLTAGNPGRHRTARYGAIGLAIFLMFAPPTADRIVRAASAPSPHGLLGLYYEGLNPDDHPPHIRRVDQTIDFPDISSLGALPYPAVAIWKGWIDAPAAGSYRFIVLADDTGWLSIDGKVVIADPGPTVTRFRQEGTIQLSAGHHAILVGQRNIWGYSSMELRWQPPGRPEELVPADALSPAPMDSSWR